MVDETVIEILAIEVSGTNGSLDFEDTLPDQEGNIKSPSSEIEDKDFALTDGLLIETVGDGSSSGLVDDTEHIKARDSTSVLGGLTVQR